MTFNAGAQTQAVNNGNGTNGDGTNNGTGGNGTGSDSGQNGNSTNGDNTGNANGGNGNGNGTNGVTDPNGSGDGANGGGSGGTGNGTDNFGFEGEFDPARARTLITTLREEKRVADKSAADTKRDLDELKQLLKGGGVDLSKLDNNQNNGNQGTGGNAGSQTDNSGSLALEEIRKMQNQLMEEKLFSRFNALATSDAFKMRPEAVELAWGNARAALNVVEGVPTNMTEVLGGLKQTAGFMFAPQTNGQQQNGSTGAGVNQSNGEMPSNDEAKMMQAFGFEGSIQEWRALKTGVPLPKPKT